MWASLDPELDGLTERIIGARFRRLQRLGHGFLEAVDRSALVEASRLSGRGLFRRSKALSVHYRDKRVRAASSMRRKAPSVSIQVEKIAGRSSEGSYPGATACGALWRSEK
jgi:hypothetical protein